MDAHRRAAMVGVAWLATQLAVPLTRLDASRQPPSSPRFSWSMFAGRPLATCAHHLRWTTSDGDVHTMPLPPVTHPAYRVLTARTPDEFRRVVPLLTSYADSDEAVIGALHDLLRRHKTLVDPGGRFVLTSALECRAFDGRTLHRALRL